MLFKDEHGRIINHLHLEKTEQDQAEKYITTNSVVLELGARYGTVSCIINNKIGNRLNQVSVEPDERVHKALEENMKLNGCNFHIIKGIISESPGELIMNKDSDYATTTLKNNKGNVQNFRLKDIEEQFNLKFNTLVADCEGFLGQFFDENPHLYSQLDLIIIECDYEHTCNYRKIWYYLEVNNFENIENGFHQVWKKRNVVTLF